MSCASSKTPAPHQAGSIDPVRDIQTMDTEFILTIGYGRAPAGTPEGRAPPWVTRDRALIQQDIDPLSAYRQF